MLGLILAALGFLVGVILGSFVKAASERLLENRSILGRSYCKECQKTLAWYDLFPVLSYLQLKGRCRYCHKPIPQSDLYVEILMGTAVGVWSMVYGVWWDLPYTIFTLFIFTILALVFFVDLKSGLILDKITYPAIVVSLLYRLIFTPTLLIPAVFVSLALVVAFIFLILITHGKGMGWGDIKYVLFLGLSLGFPKAVVGVFLAFLIGAIISLFLISCGKRRFGQTIPFGPFLSLGAYFGLTWGENFLNWYLTLSR